MGVDVRLLVCHDAWYLSCTRLTATGGWGGVPPEAGHCCTYMLRSGSRRNWALSL